MLHQRMVSSAAKRYEPALVGDNITIHIERPDKMDSLSQQNVLGVIADVLMTCTQSELSMER